MPRVGTPLESHNKTNSFREFRHSAASDAAKYVGSVGDAASHNIQQASFNMMKFAAALLAASAVSATGVNDSRRQLQDAACPDLNADGAVNVSDLLMLLAAYGTSAEGDTNGDGATDVADLLALLAAYGAENQCAPGGGGAQPITFGNIAFETRNCEYDATAAAAAGYNSPAQLYDTALAAFNACPQPAGYCTVSLNSGIELSNRGVCGSGGE